MREDKRMGNEIQRKPLQKLKGSVATTTGWAYLINGVIDKIIYKAYETFKGVIIRKILAHLITK